MKAWFRLFGNVAKGTLSAACLCFAFLGAPSASAGVWDVVKQLARSHGLTKLELAQVTRLVDGSNTEYQQILKQIGKPRSPLVSSPQPARRTLAEIMAEAGSNDPDQGIRQAAADALKGEMCDYVTKVLAGDTLPGADGGVEGMFKQIQLRKLPLMDVVSVLRDVNELSDAHRNGQAINLRALQLKMQYCSRL